MKKILILLSCTLIVIFSACKSTKTSSTDKPSSGCAAKISFGSMGSGIDNKVYDEIKSLIESKKLKYTEKNMGREGERELCLSLNELKGSDKTAFIDQLKKSASSGQLVSVSTE